MTATPMPGTPEFAASQVSRGYDCGVRVDRPGVLARLSADDRQRFKTASTSFAVKAYKAPRSCSESERRSVQRELSLLVRR